MDNNKYLPITFDNLKESEKYGEDNNYKYYLNCNIIDRRIFCNILQFLVECQKNKINLDDSFIVYIGDISALCLNIIKKLFPNIMWLLYTQNLFIIHNDDKNVIFKNYHFEDNDIEKTILLFKNSNRKNFLYICDMDFNNNDFIEIYIKQHEWLLKLKCTASCLKFKLPEYIEKNDEEYKKLNIIDNKISYLDGTIFFQAYTSKKSLDTKLISFAPFKNKIYDILEYEKKIKIFHLKIRNNEFIYKNSEKYVFINTYDEILEYYIMHNYNKINKKFDNMFDFYNMINSIFKSYNISNNVECKIKLFVHSIKKILNDNNFSSNEKEKNILFLIYTMEKIVTQINIFKNNENNFKNLDLHIDEYYIKKNDNNDIYINKEEIEDMMNYYFQ